MVMGSFLSVVINIINILCSIVKTENHPPVRPHSHGPEAFQWTSERMQTETRHIHMGHGRSGVKSYQNIPQLASVFRVYTALVVLFKKTLQPFVADGPYQSVM